MIEPGELLEQRLSRIRDELSQLEAAQCRDGNCPSGHEGVRVLLKDGDRVWRFCGQCPRYMFSRWG